MEIKNYHLSISTAIFAVLILFTHVECIMNWSRWYRWSRNCKVSAWEVVRTDFVMESKKAAWLCTRTNFIPDAFTRAGKLVQSQV